MLQQRRRISSGGSSVSGSSFHNVKGNARTTGIQLSQRPPTLSASSAASSIPSPTKTEAQQPQVLSGGRLLMQQLNAGSINNGRTRPQHFGAWAQNDESYRMLPRRPRYATDQQQAIVEQFQAPLNQQRDILMRDHLDQQQQQQLMQGIMNRSSHVQHSVQEQPITSRDQFGGADGERGRSLLQQLLSD